MDGEGESAGAPEHTAMLRGEEEGADMRERGVGEEREGEEGRAREGEVGEARDRAGGGC